MGEELIIPETKRFVEGSAAGRAAAGGGGANAEMEKSRRNPNLAAAAIVLELSQEFSLLNGRRGFYYGEGCETFTQKTM